MKKKSDENKPTFWKIQLVQAKRFAPYKDALNAVLQENQSYTAEECATILRQFMERSVN
ncbi:MAG: hypothetical protein RR977_00990 [Oscillospiraceae bacterium]